MENEELYQHVHDEFESKRVNKALWTKSFSEAEGNTSKAKALYIKYRVEQLVSLQSIENKKVVSNKPTSSTNDNEKQFAGELTDVNSFDTLSDDNNIHENDHCEESIEPVLNGTSQKYNYKKNFFNSVVYPILGTYAICLSFTLYDYEYNFLYDINGQYFIWYLGVALGSYFIALIPYAIIQIIILFFL